MTLDLAATEKTWDAHTAAEFVGQDVDATMATMTDDPVVVHVPTAVGASGRDAVRDFYATPTGRRVVVPIVTAIGMRDGLVATEHIYWDPATVLAQVGLLDPADLPVTGPEQVDTLDPEPAAGAFNALLGTESR